MKLLAFSERTAKEILRDPLNLAFGLGFPIVLLLLLSAIQVNVPVRLFEIGTLTPGILVFGLSFLTLFAATLLARDRESAFLQRLYTTPLRAGDFLLGYMLPMFPLAAGQGLVCCLAAVFLGLPVTTAILMALLFLLPAALFFIGLGLMFGSLLGVKQVGGVCGALLTNLTAWLSGAWFDLKLVGGPFEKIAYALPFVHAVELERAVLVGNYGVILPHLCWVLGYGVLVTGAGMLVFLRQMKRI